MGTAQIIATVLAAAVTIVAVALAARAVMRMTQVIRLGRPDPARFADKGTRTKTMSSPGRSISASRTGGDWRIS